MSTLYNCSFLVRLTNRCCRRRSLICTASSSSACLSSLWVVCWAWLALTPKSSELGIFHGGPTCHSCSCLLIWGGYRVLLPTVLIDALGQHRAIPLGNHSSRASTKSRCSPSSLMLLIPYERGTASADLSPATEQQQLKFSATPYVLLLSAVIRCWLVWRWKKWSLMATCFWSRLAKGPFYLGCQSSSSTSTTSAFPSFHRSLQNHFPRIT
jgi:hypothetical protein